MLTAVHPKLPMRNKSATKEYYINKLGFQQAGTADYDDYLMLQKDGIEIHFFTFENLEPKENYSGIYIRTNDIETLYRTMLQNNVAIHPAAPLAVKPWGQKEFSLLDPDNNLLTFGESA